jgi:hypothetical protein
MLFYLQISLIQKEEYQTQSFNKNDEVNRHFSNSSVHEGTSKDELSDSGLLWFTPFFVKIRVAVERACSLLQSTLADRRSVRFQ